MMMTRFPLQACRKGDGPSRDSWLPLPTTNENGSVCRKLALSVPKYSSERVV